MGNDGGSIPDRRDLVKNKPKAEQADKANQIRALWFFCALSKRPLQEPVVSCALGKLYNKDALIEYLLDKSAYGDGEEICGHIRSLKDVRTLKLTPRSPPPSPGSDVAKFVCPLNLKEMNGAYPFVYINTCGCVFSQSGLKAVIGSTLPSKTLSNDESSAVDKEQLDVCPQCATKFSRSTDILPVNPSKEEEEQLCIAMEVRRSREPVKPKSKKRKANAEGAVEDNSAVAKKKKEATDTHSPSPAPAVNSAVSTASKALASSLIAEEAKRKANMSDAVKSLYRSKYDQPRKETFTTMGTFTRYA
ncbi:Rtf2 RING-finger-domain-containing protein [Pisolithus thermaeus]|nr:Rtf2 RING-finger-domain-containing protein [Pisolithus thermaeus]